MSIKPNQKVNRKISKTTLADKWIIHNSGQRMLTPVHNVTVFVGGAALFTPNYKPYYKNPTGAVGLLTMKGQEGIAFFSETTFISLVREMFGEYWKDAKILKKRAKQFDKFKKIIDQIYSKITYNYVDSTPINNLLRDVEKITVASRHLNTLSWFSILFDQALCEKFLEEFGVDISRQRLKEIWSRGVTPAFESFDKARRAYLLKLVTQKISWKEIAESCQYFYANYNRIFNLNEAQKDLEANYGRLLPTQATNLLEKEQQEKFTRQADYKKWLKTLNRNEQKLVVFLQELMRFRDNRKDAIGKALAVAYRVAQRMFREANLPERLIYFYTYEEILKGMKYLITNRRAILNRPKGFTLFFTFDAKPIREYGAFEKIKNKLINLYRKQERLGISEQITEIKGQPAYLGKVVAKVKIVRDPLRAEHFHKGDVLVTGMTRPEFVPLMKKAGAIVTDEGGITCHAAIVSRELRKPCIIGTRIASQVLKDGDLVEVDANNSVVKILERAK